MGPDPNILSSKNVCWLLHRSALSQHAPMPHGHVTPLTEFCPCEYILTFQSLCWSCMIVRLCNVPPKMKVSHPVLQSVLSLRLLVCIATHSHGPRHGHAVILRFCRPVTPSSCQIVLTRHLKTTSCQHKLVTTHQLSVECPCTPS